LEDGQGAGEEADEATRDKLNPRLEQPTQRVFALQRWFAEAELLKPLAATSSNEPHFIRLRTSFIL
jgi:hypothetical protein